MILQAPGNADSRCFRSPELCSHHPPLYAKDGTKNPGEPLHRGCFSSYGCILLVHRASQSLAGMNPLEAALNSGWTGVRGISAFASSPLGCGDSEACSPPTPRVAQWDEMPVSHSGHVRGRKASSVSSRLLSHFLITLRALL